MRTKLLSGGTTLGKSQRVRKLHISATANSTEADYLRLLSETSLRHFVNECVFESINFANANKRKFAKVMEIGGSGRIIKLEKKYWKPALENMLPVYVKMEEYKLCGSIKNLIDSLEEVA